MNKLQFVFLIIFIGVNDKLLSQDTIFKKNGSQIAAKIIEINSSDVKFKKFNNPEGPLYTETKTEILRIKYFNGHIDTFAIAPPVAAVTTPTVKVINTACKILKNSAKYYCFDSKLGYKDVMFLLDKRAIEINSADLTDCIQKINMNKGFQQGLAIAAIPCFASGGGLAMLGGFYYLLTGETQIMEMGLGIVAVGLTLEMGSVTAGVYKNARYKEAIKLYNDSL